MAGLFSAKPAAPWPNACATFARCRKAKPLWHAGRGFVVRDLPWSEEKLRAIPPFEFENWAVITLGGIRDILDEEIGRKLA